jgi:hypothetical protein
MRTSPNSPFAPARYAVRVEQSRQLLDRLGLDALLTFSAPRRPAASAEWLTRYPRGVHAID